MTEGFRRVDCSSLYKIKGMGPARWLGIVIIAVAPAWVRSGLTRTRQDPVAEIHHHCLLCFIKLYTLANKPVVNRCFTVKLE